jgi:hypothetical protein
MKMRIFKLVVLTLALFSFVSVNQPAGAADSSVMKAGPKGQILKVSKAKSLVDGERVTVSGNKYNMKIGIYVTLCVIPKPGKRPEICGPYDVTGANNQSVWVSSNPPIYAAFLVTPFSAGGSFRVSIPVHNKIGDYDCRLVRCAVLTRADHTNSDIRSADVIIPVTFNK